MIKVKIVDGAAVEVDQLNTKNKYKAFWNPLFLKEFRIIRFDNEEIPIVEGNTYWAWPLGNGRISLVEEIQP